MRAALVLLATLLLGAATAGAALAHAQLQRSMPEDGALLPAPPPVMALHFNEPVRPTAIKLVGPDGTVVDATWRTAGGVVEIIAARPVPPGTNLLTWRVVSGDGHPVAGTVTFAVGSRTAGPEAGEDRPVLPMLATLATRAGLLLGLLFGIGGALAVRWLPAPADPAVPVATRTARAALALAAVALPAAFMLQGRDLAGEWGGAAAAAASTSALPFLGIASGAVALAWLALALAGPAGRLVAATSVLLVAVSLATTGHASTAPPAWLSAPAVAVHGAAALLWAGPLPLLAAACGRPGPGFDALLRRFSMMAVMAVATLVAAGVVLVAVQLRAPADLVDTAYGRVLAVKLGLVAALLGLALVNKWRLTPAIRAGSAVAARRLRVSVIAEIALFVALAAVVSCWRFTPPPRALAAPALVERHVHMHGADAMADVTLAPGRPGLNGIVVVGMTADFAPLPSRETTVTLALESRGIAPIERRAVQRPDGTWAVDGLALPLAGVWSLRVDFLVSDFDKVTLEGEIEVRAAAP